MTRMQTIVALNKHITNLNKPSKYWPDNEIYRYVATEEVVDELINRLLYRKNQTPSQIINDYKQEVKNQYQTMSELTKSSGLLTLWSYCTELVEELEMLYFSTPDALGKY